MSQNGAQQAVVTGTFSRRMTLRMPDGTPRDARIKGKLLKPVCGDRVLAQPISGEPDWLIVEILPRDNELTRPDRRGRPEVLAANLTRVCVVCAEQPAPDWFVVDRYLCAAELMGVGAAIVFNKSDIAGADPRRDEILGEYARIAYPVLRCSARSAEGLDALETLLTGQTSIIVGQSGVGKSSLINCLVADADRRTAALSQARAEGRHTTVNSAMLTLRGGGFVIDSPGVRDYAPGTATAADAMHGYREIAAMAQDCRFANCRHLREPGCAVRTGVASGAVSARRYESYRRLVALARRLAEKRES